MTRWRPIGPAAVARRWAGVACTSLCGWACAAGLSTTLPNGQTLGVVETSTPEHIGLSFERRSPDGTRDRQFGPGGRVFFSMGSPGAVATTVRADASGHILVTGDLPLADGSRGSVLARFLSSGQADARWGDRGLARLPAAGGDSMATDVLPHVDGSLLVVGAVETAGTQKVCVWRIDASGQSDARFGRQGVLIAASLPGSKALSLLTGPDGAVQIAVQTSQGRGTWIEVHRWRSGDVFPLRVARQALPDQWLGPAELVLRHGQWFWLDPAQQDSPLAVEPLKDPDSPWAPPDEARAAAVESADQFGNAAMNPYAGAPTRVDQVSAEAGIPTGCFVIAAAAVAIAGALFWRSTRQ